jgi:hypothetical protein
MKVGDRVRITGVPPNLKDDEDLQTLSLFQKCVGKTFVVAGIEEPEGLAQKLLRFDVGHVVGEQTYAHTIWIEQEFVELDSSAR